MAALPQARLASRIEADWQWLSGLYTSYSQSTALRQNCTSFRQLLQSAGEAAWGARARADAAVARLTASPPAALAYKEAALDFRRRYKVAIVAAIAAASILPAVRAPGKLEKARIAVRNFVFVGGGATVLLYPELTLGMWRTAEMASGKREPKSS